MGLLEFFAQVDEFDSRQGAFSDALGESQQLIFSPAGVMEGFERGRGGAEQRQRVF